MNTLRVVDFLQYSTPWINTNVTHSDDQLSSLVSHLTLLSGCPRDGSRLTLALAPCPPLPHLCCSRREQDCPTSYTMKSVAQTLCILSMLFYSLTFGTDLSLCMETLHPWYGHGLRWESTSGEGRQFLSL